MPIEHAPPPADGEDLLRDNLGAILQGPAAHWHGAPVTISEVRISQPHPVYHYGLDDLLAGGELDRAHDGGWRYFIYDGTDLIGTALLGYGEGGTTEFAGLTSGPSVDATLQALAYLEVQEAIRFHPHQLRAIHVPAVPFSALWGHGAQDHFVAVHTAWGLDAMRLHAWADIVQALLPRAREVRAQAGFA